MPKFSVRRAVVSAGLAGALAFSGTAMAFAEEAPATPNDGVQAADEATYSNLEIVLTDPTGAKQPWSNTLRVQPGTKLADFTDYFTHSDYDGYEFLGWRDSRTGLVVTTTEMTSQLATSDVTFTTVYQPKQTQPTPDPDPEATVNVAYELTDPQGNVVDSKTLGLKSGDSLSKLLDYVGARQDYDGYDFVGWRDSRTGLVVTTTEMTSQLATSDVTFTTVYQKQAETPKPDPEGRFSVFFDITDPATGEVINTREVVHTETGPVQGVPGIDSHDGYKFLGWKGEDGAIYSQAALSRVIVSSETRFTTAWEKEEAPVEKATVKFMVTNPETDEVLYNQSVETTEGAKVNLPAGLPSVEGYSLDHWIDQDGKTYQASLSDFTAPAGTTTLLAQWTKNDVPQPIQKATVKFIMTNPETDQIIFEKTVETTAGSKVALTELAGLPAVDGYSLNGWMDQTGATYEASLGDFAAPAGETTMLAQLTKNDTPDPIQKATVKFMVTNPETDEVLFDQSVDTTEGASVSLPAGLPALDGYSLDHWIDQDGNVYQAALSDFVAPAGNTTLLAQWTKNDTPDPIVKVNVTFIATEPGTDTVAYDSTVEAISGDAVAAPEDMAGLFEGYTLTGFVDKAGNTYGADLAGYVAPKTDDILYAQYTKDETPVEWATATFYDMDGETVLGTADYQVNEPLNFWAVEPGPREGYTFDGYAIRWKATDGVVDPAQVTMSKDGMEFIAMWSKDEAPIEWAKATFLNEDGSLLGTADYQVNEALNVWAVEPAPREGYTFKGYAIQGKEEDGVVDPSLVTMSTDGMTFVAVWEKDAAPIEWAQATFLDADGSVIGTADYQVNETMGFWAVIPGQREDAKFRGYEIQGKDGVVDPNDITMSKDGMTFVAVWEQNEEPVAPVEWAKATFLDEDGETVLGTADYQIGETMGFWAVIPGQREDAKFRGYEIQGKDGVVDPNDITMSKDGMTFVAVWEKVQTPAATEHKVTFDTDGGSAVESQMVEDGKTVTKPADPTKDGFKFDGWTLDGNPFDFAAVVKSDITLTAKWVKVGGTETPTDPEKPGDDANKPSDDNKKPGDKNDGKDEGKKDDSQKKDQLPKTGDDTNVAGLAAAGAAGVAALGAGAVLLNRRKREQN